MNSTRAPVIERWVAAVPDAITAAVLLCIWIAPMSFGESGVRNGMLLMLIEFILVHAAGFLGAVVIADEGSRGKRTLALLGFTAMYLLFIGAFMLIFREWWPLAAFAWLLLGKLAVLFGKQQRSEQKQQMMAGWALSVMVYVLGVFATVFLPVPRLGMHEELLPSFGLTGGGLWVDEPHRVIAFGVLYFGTLALCKWRGWTFAAMTPPSGAKRAHTID